MDTFITTIIAAAGATFLESSVSFLSLSSCSVERQLARLLYCISFVQRLKSEREEDKAIFVEQLSTVSQAAIDSFNELLYEVL